MQRDFWDRVYTEYSLGENLPIFFFMVKDGILRKNRSVTSFIYGICFCGFFFLLCGIFVGGFWGLLCGLQKDDWKNQNFGLGLKIGLAENSKNPVRCLQMGGPGAVFLLRLFSLGVGFFFSMDQWGFLGSDIWVCFGVA